MPVDRARSGAHTETNRHSCVHRWQAVLMRRRCCRHRRRGPASSGSRAVPQVIVGKFAFFRVDSWFQPPGDAYWRCVFPVALRRRACLTRCCWPGWERVIRMRHWSLSGGFSAQCSGWRWPLSVEPDDAGAIRLVSGDGRTLATAGSTAPASVPAGTCCLCRRRQRRNSPWRPAHATFDSQRALGGSSRRPSPGPPDPA